MIWREAVSLEVLQQSIKGTMCEYLEMVFTEVDSDSLSATMPVRDRTMQPAGLLHGGASVVLAESLGSIASALCIDSAHSMPVGIEINASHLKSVSTGIVTGRVTSVRRGRTIHVWNIDIENDKRERICTSRLTVMIVKRR